MWGYVHSYQDSSNLQQQQTVVPCKTQTAPSGQKRCLQEGGQMLYKQAKYTLEKEIRVEKRNYYGKLRIKFQWFCFSVEKSERHHQLQDTILQHSGESITGRRSEWVLLQVWKNTIQISCNPPLPHTCTADKRRGCVPGLQKEQEKEGTRPRWCVTSLPKNLHWPASHHLLHTALQQITGAVRSPLML